MVRGIGKRLFEKKPKAQTKKEEEWLKEWILSLPEETQEKIRQGMEEEEEERRKKREEARQRGEEVEEKPWYDEGRADEGSQDDDLNLNDAWKAYRKVSEGGLPGPFEGPSSWDITRWTEEDKKPYLLGRRSRMKYL